MQEKLSKNSEELFPLVNERGEVIGAARRAECHGGTFWLHPVVHLHLFNYAGELYLQKRSATKDTQPNKWDTAVGGHVEYGESIESALLREMQEELGVVGVVPQLLTTYTFRSDCEHELVYSYKAVYNGEITPDPTEISEGRFWKLTEIAKQLGRGLFTPNFEQEFRRLFYPSPPIVGITGGIGSGKSALATQLVEQGYRVYDTDSEAKRIINTNSGVREQIKRHFGEQIYQADGIDRARVAAQVFSSKERLQQLNSIVHPAVIEDIKEWAKQHQNQPYLFVESAILFESGLNQLCTKTVTITAPEALRIARVVQRDKTTQQAVEARMKQQLSDYERAEQSDFVIANDETRPISELVAQLIGYLHTDNDPSWAH